MLSLGVGVVVRQRRATRAAMLLLSTADLAGVLGMERRGRSISGDVIGHSTINCVGADKDPAPNAAHDIRVALDIQHQRFTVIIVGASNRQHPIKIRRPRH